MITFSASLLDVVQVPWLCTNFVGGRFGLDGARGLVFPLPPPRNFVKFRGAPLAGLFGVSRFVACCLAVLLTFLQLATAEGSHGIGVQPCASLRTVGGSV